MAEASPTPRLRFTNRSVLLAVALFGVTLVLLRIVAASGRVIGWIVTAAFVAGLLLPLVEGLARRMPRGLAVLVVYASFLACIGGVAYAVVDEVVAQVRELQEAAPRAARQLERSDRFGDFAREFEIADRVATFTEELPERLRGGDVQSAVRSAATRGVAFLATGVLTLFFIIHGRKLIEAGIRQLPSERRHLVRYRVESVYERSWRYMFGSLAMSFMSGLLAFGCAWALDLPGRTPLALWMALFDLVPLLGAIVGALPLVLLALADSPTEGLLVGAVFVAWQLFEAFHLQRRVEARSIHLGPWITVAFGMVGLELYGIGGAIVAVSFAVVLFATLDEVAATSR
jgi:predicted PurR-regulated permease PerM